jgi:hypothetical protein
MPTQNRPTAGAPSAAGGASNTDAERAEAERQEHATPSGGELTDEQRESNVRYREQYQRSSGSTLTELERERLDTLGSGAHGPGSLSRSTKTAITSQGPIDHVDPEMRDKDLWKRQEQAHIKHNQDEVERAAKFCEQNGLEGLTTVKSGLVGINKDRVAFTEYNDAHPHGFAYVAGSDSPPVIVALTPEVQGALLTSRIVEAEADVPSGSSEHVQKVQPRGRRR